jgi:hypothetical protein
MRTEFIPSLLSHLVAIARQISPLVHILAVVWLVLLFWKRPARLLVVRACGLISALDLLLWALPRTKLPKTLLLLQIASDSLEGLLLASLSLLVTAVPLQLLRQRRKRIPAAESLAGVVTSSPAPQPGAAPRVWRMRIVFIQRGSRRPTREYEQRRHWIIPLWVSTNLPFLALARTA